MIMDLIETVSFFCLPFTQAERSKQVFGSVRQALDHISARAIFK